MKVLDPEPATSTVIEREDGATAENLKSSTTKYAMAPMQIRSFPQALHEIPTPYISEWVSKVVLVESPIRSIEVARRITHATGATKVGSRIEGAVNEGIKHAIQARNIRLTGEFLWRFDMTEPTLRDRSNLPASSRKIELVSPEELSIAVRRVVAASYGIAFQDITGAAVKLLGFGRVTNEIRSTVEPLISQMVTDGTLTRQGDLLLVSNGQGNGSASQ